MNSNGVPKKIQNKKIQPKKIQNNKSQWIDRGDYLEHPAPQGTDDWLDARIGLVTGSNSGALGGKSTFKTPEQIGKIIAGVEVEHFEQKNIDAMSHGSEYEKVARNWYEKTYNCKVLERGLCKPKTPDIIGASIDGDIINTDGMIEIKCPKKMWKPILTYMDMKNTGWIPPPGYIDHIWTSHLCQIQQSLYILKKKYCDYIVYSTEDCKVFVQRIYFDPIFWSNHYSIIQTNYKLYVLPYL